MSRTRTQHWTADAVPDLTGRVHVVTGATSGLGLATTRALALRGGRVVLAVRDEEKGHRTAAGLAAEGIAPDLLTVRRIDLADLDSVRAFAEGLRADHPRLDVLVNNAGVMGPPRTLSAQGHELQFAANHLGHFALTGLLLDRLPAGGRVVTVSSLVHRQGRLPLDDPAALAGERGYAPMAFYNRSKLANALFGQELHRRLTAAGSLVRSVLAHPGYTATSLQTRDATGLARFFYGRIGNPLLAQRPERGVLPQLYAATAPDAAGGDFIGPDGPGELRGFPSRVKPSATAADPETGRRLWDLSEELTGVRYGFTSR
ncbi:oxidoreductase [Streptomyces sp. NPDC058052]|uniref:oxidoreductase n=1 Tax=Streptomyces sp. NPDC058052 TaxID=3346316 RepID=UPI0036E05F6F